MEDDGISELAYEAREADLAAKERWLNKPAPGEKWAPADFEYEVPGSKDR